MELETNDSLVCLVGAVGRGFGSGLDLTSVLNCKVTSVAFEKTKENFTAS